MVVEVMDFTSGESAEKKSRFRPKSQGFFSEIKFSVLCRLCEAEVTSRLFPPCCTEIKNARRRLPSGVEKSKAMEQFLEPPTPSPPSARQMKKVRNLRRKPAANAFRT